MHNCNLNDLDQYRNGLRVVILAMVIGMYSLCQPALAFSVTGQISLITPPGSVLAGALESSDTAWVFRERQNILLAADLSVDTLLSTGFAGQIESGERVSSYFLHFDPEGGSSSADAEAISGVLTFDVPVLGLIWGGYCRNGCPTSGFLGASDFLGAPTVIYPVGEDQSLGRGLEIGSFYDGKNGQDHISFSADHRTVFIDRFSAHFPRVDQMRIITVAELSEASGIEMMAFGLLGVVFVRNRRLLKKVILPDRQGFRNQA